MDSREALVWDNHRYFLQRVAQVLQGDPTESTCATLTLKCNYDMQ